MHVGCGARIYVERYAQACERLLDERMVAVHHILRRDALLAGAYGDGHSVLVAAADEQHLLSLKTEIPRIDVGRDIDSGQVADMHRPVGVRQGRGDKCTLEFFHRFVCFFPPRNSAGDREGIPENIESRGNH